MSEGLPLPQPCYEPVSTAIGLSSLLAGGFAAAGVGYVGAFALGSALGGALIGIGGSFALSAAAAALQRSDRQSTLPGGAGVQGGQGALNDQLRAPQIGPIPQQRLALGTVTTAGVLNWRRSKPPFIWRNYLLAAHKCGSFVGMRLNGVDVPLRDPGTGILQPTSTPYFNGTKRYLEVAYRDGDPNQAMCPIVARDFPAMPATFRQRGTASVTIKADFGTDVEDHELVYGTENNFNPLFRFEGAAYFDPRVPVCTLSDTQTWVHGSNGSLNLMRYLYHPWPDMRLLDPARINWDRMADAANVDDLWRGTLAGTIQRNHTVDGLIVSSADSLQTVRELLTAIDGLFVQSKGKYFTVPGHKRKPIGTITQDMLADGFDIQFGTPDRDLINTVKTEIVAPDRDYKPVVGPVLKRTDLIAKDRKPLETTLTLPFTEGPPRGQRLGMRKLKRSRGDDASGEIRKTFSGVFSTVNCGQYQAGDVVRIWFRDIPHARMLMQIMNTERNETQTKVSISGSSYFESVFDFYAPADEKPFTIDENVLSAEAA